MAKMIVVNEWRCLGCKSCELECALAHCQAASLAEALAAETPPQSRLHVEPLEGRPARPAGEVPLEQCSMPLQCRHCEDAPCITVCPTGAIRRAGQTGPVLLDTDLCIGCKYCVLVCPFGVVGLSRDGRAAVKCDLCIERTEAGEPPACVAACPTGALEFRDLEEWTATRRRTAAARIAESRPDEEDPAGQ